MNSSRLLYLSAADVAAVGPDLRTIIGLLETAFREKGEGRVEMPPKPGIHPRGDAFIHAMPAYWDTLQNRRGRDLISKTPVYNKVRYDAVATTRPATEEEIKTLPEAEDDPKEEAVE